MPAGKLVLLLGGLFAAGLLAGNFWYYLGDRNNIINRYLEAHSARFPGYEEGGTGQAYYILYNDAQALRDYVDSHEDFSGYELTSINTLARVNIAYDSIPEALDRLREQEFIRFVLPGTFPFICH